MPYLTPTATGLSSTDVRLGFGIPGFAHPSSHPRNGPNSPVPQRLCTGLF